MPGPQTSADPKVVLITGCSTGIGRDLAGRAALAGHTVIATARDVGALEGLDVSMRVALDVTDELSVRDAIQTVLDTHGRIDVLVNNAGFCVSGAVEELGADALRSMFDVNVFGVLALMRAVLPVMRRQSSGLIVNVSSLGGVISLPANGGYSATKFAIEALSDAARQELGPFGVDVTVVQPGSIASRFDSTMRACSADTLQDEASPYRELYRATDAMNAQMRSAQVGPGAVSKVILRAMAAPRPKTRYRVNVSPVAGLLLLLPDRLRDRAFDSARGKALAHS